MLQSPLSPHSATSTFDLVVVGAGGGPDETNLSAYLVKPRNTEWEDGILALEAGSGQGTLAQLLRKDPHIFHSVKPKGGAVNKVPSASDIYSLIQCFLLTHAHLDHINSLVVSAGSLRGTRKRVYGLEQTLQDLELVFSDRIWPNLASWKEDDDDFKLLYSALKPDGTYQLVFPDVSVQAIQLNHGRNSLGQHLSTAFFIRHESSQREFLFFGDVEPDSIAEKPQTINVWRAAAPKIPDTLSSIFIECSWPAGRNDDILFGHLTPEHLGNELAALAAEVVKFRIANQQNESRRRPVRKKQKRNSLTSEDLRDALDGVRVYIIHCKDDMNSDSDRPIREIIVEQVRRIVEERGLGAKILPVEQGACIAI
ncbi:cyclic-AMP phosphodiesterase [Gymnopilus junonius]|uniref:Cyclic-AMP phosphodiesterase n=1 Tax=Gymnopilus junonius TaxID=109634 RepID=A0A9P5NC21_GYMJU|nr:cyclic-AMP phosphodiesterase [Gymnopilus junonius]